ncbi:hypothetical protein [Vibrio maritimus]|uniref:hypothetical protein n=1 Tax=Vibrio maritimus TaxID=990268 RepID=UPI001F1FFF8F|nr:hypothetical protein [Vibrio maritimus]
MNASTIQTIALKLLQKLKLIPNDLISLSQLDYQVPLEKHLDEYRELITTIENQTQFFSQSKTPWSRNHALIHDEYLSFLCACKSNTSKSKSGSPVRDRPKVIGNTTTQQHTDIVNDKQKPSTLPDQAQFERDVEWYQNKMIERSLGFAYWEEIFDCSFSRGAENSPTYWHKVHKEASRRFEQQLPSEDLDFKASYRELNRLALFIINVIAGCLIDTQGKINTDTMEEILQITHNLWNDKAPRTLEQHDHVVSQLLACLKRIEINTNSPFTEFVHYDEIMNIQRLKQGSDHDHSNEQGNTGSNPW